MSADISGIGGRITVLTLVATRGKISVEGPPLEMERLADKLPIERAASR